MTATFKTIAAAAARLALAGVISTVVLATAVRSADAQTAQDDTVSQVVSLADLNLANPAGQATLQHRLRVAATQVCQESVGSDPAFSSAFTDCYRQALTDAKSQAQARVAEAKAQPVLAANVH